MKRHGNLWNDLVSFENIYKAAMKAKKRKRWKNSFLYFQKDFEPNLIHIQDSLITKTYQPGSYKKFLIYEPKRREISAAPYRDRIVHHAICNCIEPIFQRTFIDQSFSNQKGKGTHKAVELYRQYAFNNLYVLKCDIKKYFPSIDHKILKNLIQRKIKDKQVLELINLIIDNSNQQEPIFEYFEGDTLFTPYERRKGIPIGNLTSQFFANVYLNPLDHFVKETLGCKSYIRYVDDFVLLDNDKRKLIEYLRKIEKFLAKYRLKLHERKVVLTPTQKGIKFLGYKVFPNRIELKTENIRRYKMRMKKYRTEFKEKKITLEKIKQSMASWGGYVKHASSKNIGNKINSGIWV